MALTKVIGSGIQGLDIKSTGVHTPQGLLFHNKLQTLNNKNKIENHKIFKFLSQHFGIYA